MGHKKFESLKLDLIEEGEFVRNANEDLQTIATELFQYIAQHGCEASEGVKAELTIKITLKADNPQEGDFSVKTGFSKKMPGRPAKVTRAIQDREQDGTPTLFVRTSGSTDDNPRQHRLATEDGRPVDLESGKAPPIDTPPVKKPRAVE